MASDDVNTPLRKQTDHTRRYEATKQLSGEHHEIDQHVSQTLGGPVAVNLQSGYNKQGRRLHTTTHGAPLFSIHVFSGRREEQHMW